MPANITFAAGETSKVVTITILNDTVPEADKTVSLTLGGAIGVRQGAQATHVVTIADDDSPPPVQFANTSVTVQEHVGTIGARIVLGWPAPSPVTVPITINSASTAGSGDCSGVPASITFDAGESSKFISFTITDDDLVESNETLVLDLGAPVGGVLGAANSFSVTIEDNDPSNDPGNRWALRFPLPAGELFHGIATNGGRQVIVGDAGLVLTSDDAGVTWVRRFSGSSAAYERVAAAGSGFIAVGNAGRVLVSPDGIVWSESVVSGAEQTSFYGCAAVGAKTVIVGAEEGVSDYVPVIYYSADRLVWKRSALPPGVFGKPGGVAWSGSLYVVVGGEGTLIFTSPDGIVWTDHSNGVPAGVKFREVIWAGDKFLAFDQTTKAYSSTNGVLWSPKTLGVKAIYNAVYTGTQVLGVGDAGTIAVSANGNTWNQSASSAKFWLNGVVKTASNYIAIGSGDTVITSPDGVKWTTRSSSADERATLSSVVWSGKQFVAATGGFEDYTLFLTSPDGIVWTKRPTKLKVQVYSLAWSGTIFVGVGPGGAVLTSADGVAWSPRASGTKLDLHGVVWGKNQFVAVGGNETDENYFGQIGGSILLTSPNGVAWTRRTIPTAHALEGIAFSGSTFVATGRSTFDGGNTEAAVLTSPDAVTWTLRSSGVMGKDLGPIVWNGSLFVTTHEDYGIYHSPDGTGWTAAASLPPVVPAYDGFQVHGMCWTGTQFLVAGSNGMVLTSPDADVWTMRQTEVHGMELYGVAWNGEKAVVVGENASIQTSSNGLAVPIPAVQFAVNASSVSESGGVALIEVRMTSAPTEKVTVPLTFAAGVNLVTAGALADLVLPAATLVFNPGETSKHLSVAIKPDARDEAPETLDVTIAAPVSGAVVGAPFVHRLTVTDDDTAPTLLPMGDPVSQMVKVGDPITLKVSAAGTPPLTYVWKKNGAVVAGATGSVLYIPKAALANGGSYTCTINNATATPRLSQVAEVAVFEKLTKRVAGLSNKDVVLTQGVGGTAADLELKWYDSTFTEVLPNPPHVTFDAARKTLTVKQPILPGDIQSYQCRILQKSTSQLYNGNLYNVDIVTAKPTLSAIILPPAQVGVHYVKSIAAGAGSATVASWSAPALGAIGLAMDSYTGEISGYPTVAGTKSITIIATNGAGSASVVTSLVISALPAGVAGLWNGLIERDAGVNNNLGSRLELTVTPAGTYTGKYISGASAVSIGGQCDVSGADVVADTNFLLPGNIPAKLHFAFVTTATPPVLAGSLTVQPAGTPAPSVALFEGWRSKSPVTGYVGKHNFALELDASQTGDAAIPQGTGFGSAVVTATGAVTVAGKVCDSGAYTSSSFVGASGQCLLYGSLYGGKGSIVGVPVLTLAGTAPGYEATTIADLSRASWVKLPDTTPAGARNYSAGWAPISIKLKGQRYNPPAANAVVMGMAYTSGTNNATVDLLNAGLPSGVSADVAIKAAGTIDFVVHNPYRIALTVTPGTGAFKGTANLSAQLSGTVIARNPVAFEGLIVPNRVPSAAALHYEGVGFFMLPQLPDSNISPLPAAASTKILSGKAVLTPNQP